MLKELEYQGVKVITADLIAQMHKVEKSEIHRIYLRNQNQFINEKDVFSIKKIEAFQNGSESFRELFGSNAQKEAYLFTERGYLKLVKIMNSQKSWEIYEQVLDIYFTAKKVYEQKKEMTLDDYWNQYQAALKKSVEELSTRVDVVENEVAKVSAQVSTNVDLMTVRGFCHLHKINMTQNEMKIAGQEMSSVGCAKGKINDPIWGQVNLYHINDLKIYFNKK